MKEKRNKTKKNESKENQWRVIEKYQDVKKSSFVILFHECEQQCAGDCVRTKITTYKWNMRELFDGRENDLRMLNKNRTKKKIHKRH